MIVNKRVTRLPDYTYLGCPLTKNRSPWCFRLCKPDLKGTGFCGRYAPHSLKGSIQQGIIDYKIKLNQSSINKIGTK